MLSVERSIVVVLALLAVLAVLAPSTAVGDPRVDPQAAHLNAPLDTIEMHPTTEGFVVHVAVPWRVDAVAIVGPNDEVLGHRTVGATTWNVTISGAIRTGAYRVITYQFPEEADFVVSAARPVTAQRVHLSVFGNTLTAGRAVNLSNPPASADATPGVRVPNGSRQ